MIYYRETRPGRRRTVKNKKTIIYRPSLKITVPIVIYGDITKYPKNTVLTGGGGNVKCQGHTIMNKNSCKVVVKLTRNWLLQNVLFFSRRFRLFSRFPPKKFPTLTVASFFSSVQRETSTFCALMHIYQLLPYVLSTSFSTHPKPLTWDKKSFQSRWVHFFWHYETFLLFSALWDWFFSENFFIVPPIIFDILQQNGCSKNPKASPLYVFRHYATYRKLQKKFEKKSELFFSIFSFLRVFVVSNCRKSGFRFRVFLSLDMAPTWAVHGLFCIIVYVLSWCICFIIDEKAVRYSWKLWDTPPVET